MTSHPDIVVEKKSDSPDEDKYVHDSKLLIPTLKDFFSKHPLINPKTFLGDAAFDTVGVASTSSVYAHLKILEEKGYIARKMDASRAIAIL